MAGEGSLAGYYLSTVEASEAPSVLVVEAASAATRRGGSAKYRDVTPAVHTQNKAAVLEELKVKKMRVHTLAAILEELEAKQMCVPKTGAAQGEVRIGKVCDVVVNSETIDSSHIIGKKHKANEHGHPAPTLAVHPKSAPEYLEAKKRRVLDAKAAQCEVRICKVCNVVVNSQTVYLCHITGRKHKANIPKQQQVQRCNIARDKERI